MLLGAASHYFFGITIFLTSLFLILLVLIQRGRGGGIAGALGGAGGQSAFGTKAGDFFTKLTVGVAAFWIIMCCLAIKVLKSPSFSTGVSKKNTPSMEAANDSGSSPGSGTTDAPSAAGSGKGIGAEATAPTTSNAEGAANTTNAEVTNLPQFDPPQTTPSEPATSPTTTIPETKPEESAPKVDPPVEPKPESTGNN